MASHTPIGDDRPPIMDIDLSDIFIGREQQLDLFDVYLERWKRLMAAATQSYNQVATVPSPNNKIQGLIVLLYGRGGFGKSTLLNHYRNIALEPGRNLFVSEVVDWEFALDESNRSIFNPPPGQEVDIGGYFRVLCTRLANALSRSRDQFREYNKAVTEVEQARKQTSGVIENLQRDDRYAWLRKATSQEAIALVRTFAPVVNAVPGIDTLAGAAQQGLEQSMKFGAEQAKHLHDKLRDKLGHKLDDCLDPALMLGVSLGRDLARFARDYPLLICFDTYEIVDEGDRLLRIVIGAAGARVGWVLAGRDNLWAGVEQRKRSQSRIYGDKEIVPSDRGLAIDFNIGSIGAFTGNDILTYFTLLCEKVPGRLVDVMEEDAERILDVTQGVPLAVKIAAALYWETADMEIVTAKPEGQREIVDQMVLRYLQHVQDDQGERARLYGLALLRRADQPSAIAAALGLSPEQAGSHYEAELSRLHRRYSFVFTEKAQPSLHQEVRYFLRLWLLENRRNPEVVTVNERLKAAHEATLKTLEEHRHYGSLRERMEEDDWVSVYLDLVEQQYWLDCTEGVRSCLPFMLAAAIYRRDTNQEAATIGDFFVEEIKQPYRDWWTWAVESLIYDTSSNPSSEELHGLEALAKLASQRCPTFPAPLPDYRPELEAALWWRLGEANEEEDNSKALKWYEKALSRLDQQIELREATANACWNIANDLSEEKKYIESLPFLNRAIELKPDYDNAYNSRGIAYYHLKDYQQAFRDYNNALQLDPSSAIICNNRGIAYSDLKDYPHAIQDSNHALQLDPNYADAYNNRGSAYSELKEYSRAIQDYDHALQLDPNYAHAYSNRGNAYSNLKEYQRAIWDYDQALQLDPNDAHAYYGQGLAYLWLKDRQPATADFHRSMELDLTHIEASWMVVWAGIGNERAGIAMAERLKQISEIDLQDYVAFVCCGLSLGLRDQLKDGLGELEQAISLDPEMWDAYFWKGMICAYLGRNSAAIEAIEKALEVNLPPMLLTPLYWLERDRPDFFREYAGPLLAKYGV